MQLTVLLVPSSCHFTFSYAALVVPMSRTQVKKKKGWSPRTSSGIVWLEIVVGERIWGREGGAASVPQPGNCVRGQQWPHSVSTRHHPRRVYIYRGKGFEA